MLACDVKATENSRMPAETMDRLSCVQKLNQPMRLQALAALDSWFLAYSDLTGASDGVSGAALASVLLPCIIVCKPCNLPPSQLEKLPIQQHWRSISESDPSWKLGPPLPRPIWLWWISEVCSMRVAVRNMAGRINMAV